MGSGETKVESHASSDTQPNQAALLLNTEPTNPEGNRTNVLEETPCTWQPWLAPTAPGQPQESLVRDETRISLPGQALPNPDDARPIVLRPTDLPGAAGYNRAWARSSTIEQAFKQHTNSKSVGSNPGSYVIIIISRI